MINSKNIIILDSKLSSSYKSFMNLGYRVIESYKKIRRLDFRIRALLHFLKIERIPVFSIFFELSEELYNNSIPTLIIIRGSLIFEPFLKKLRQAFPNTKILYLYSNIVDCFASVKPKTLLKYDIVGVSWDKNDCRRYGLLYQDPSFDIRILEQNGSKDINYDVCFIGKDKGRYKILRQIADVINKNGYSSFVRITPDKSIFKYLRRAYGENMTYDQYLKITQSSRCIIDLVQKGQVGTTMRTMEAIFSKKKLISNNPTLKEYDFYNPNNIFILTNKNIDDIPQFLELPFQPIPENILQKYILQDNLQNLINRTIKAND